MRAFRQLFWIALLCVAVTGCTGGGKQAEAVQPADNETSPTNPASTNASQTTPAGDNASTDIQAYFTQEGDRPEEAIIELIEEAKSTLDIAIYSLNYKPIVDAIEDAADRGVRVRMLTDREHAEEKSKQRDALQRLKKAGIPVKINRHEGKMHLKMLVADGVNVEAGSFNYLDSSVKENDDVALIIRDDQVGRRFEAAFDRMWNDKDRFEDDQ